MSSFPIAPLPLSGAGGHELGLVGLLVAQQTFRRPPLRRLMGRRV